MTDSANELAASTTVLDETIDLNDESLLTSQQLQSEIEPKVAFELEIENDIVPPQISV